MSQDPTPLLHNSELSMPDRIIQAFEWLDNPKDCPAGDQGPASAKCYLLYRAIDGLLTPEEEARVLLYKPNVVSVSLAARWAMSIATAEAYLTLSRSWDGVDISRPIERARIVWDVTTRKSWPPQILNLLRISLTGAYYQYLVGNRRESLAIIEDSFNEWKLHASTLDWKRYPHRVTEARDDLVCLQSMAFIARALGDIKFKDYDWCNPEKLWPVPHTTSCPMYAIMRRMSLILKPEGDGIVWQYRPRLGSKVEEYTKIHASKPYGQGGLSAQIQGKMATLLGEFTPKTAIDYGCGKSNDAKKLWPDADVTKYDPAIPEHSKLPRRQFDIGLCTEVMEHIPLEEIDHTIWEMRCLSRRWICTVHTGAAGQLLSNGENAHCLQRPAEWWSARFQRIFGGKVDIEVLNPMRFILVTKP